MRTRFSNANRITLMILAAVVLAVGAAALFFSRAPVGKPTREVRVFVNGELYATGRLGQAEEIVVHGDDGTENVIAFMENGVYMKSASCHNQLCVQQGMVTEDNYASRFYRNQIICLPNHVTVELVLTEAEQADIPDV